MEDSGAGPGGRLPPSRHEDGRRQGRTVGRDGGRDVARQLWTELLARLTHVADVFAQPDTADRLRSLGIRRTGTVQTFLAREYAKANQIALSTGAAPWPHEVMSRARDLQGHGDLQQDFFELAQGYRQLIAALELPENCNRQRWLAGRALVHIAQAAALQQPGR